MNKKKTTLGTGVIMSGIFAGLTCYFGNRLYDSTFGDKPKIGRVGLEEYYGRKGSMKRLKEFQSQKFMVESPQNGYLIETLHLKSHLPSSNVMVIVHGIRRNYYELLPVAFRYLEEGTNVIMYNQRQTGQTGGKNFTFGYFERFDLEEIATIARRLYPDGWVGVHGFSMGAATAAMHSELREKTRSVDFYILDGPFPTIESTLEAAFDKKQYKKLWRLYLKWSGNLMTRFRAKLQYKDIQPIKAIAKSTAPILIIHGILDRKCPFGGAKLLYEAVRHPHKELKAFTDLGHCEAHYLQTESYFATIWNFIENKCIKRLDVDHASK